MTLRKLTRDAASSEGRTAAAPGPSRRPGRTPRPRQTRGRGPRVGGEERWRGTVARSRPRTGGLGNARTLTPRAPLPGTQPRTRSAVPAASPGLGHDRGGRPGGDRQVVTITGPKSALGAPVDHTPRVVAPPRRRERLGRDEGAARESTTTRSRRGTSRPWCVLESRPRHVACGGRGRRSALVEARAPGL